MDRKGRDLKLQRTRSQTGVVKGGFRTVDGKIYLTLRQVAERTGYSVNRLRQLLIDGEIEGVKPGHEWFTTVEAVEKYQECSQARRPRTEAA